MSNLIPCAFLWLVAIHENEPYLLLQHRADGLFGTPGGKLDPGEDVITALIREIDEEAGIRNLIFDKSDMLELGQFESRGYIVHSFVKEISYEYMKTIPRNYFNATHSDEVAGMSILKITEQTVQRLIALPLAGSGNKEIQRVLDFLGVAY